MIRYYHNHTKRRFSKFDRFSKFLLAGNNIDGRVNVWTEVFQNFEEVKIRLPEIYANLEYEGEWDTSLYQVPDEFRIHHRWGYYKYPNRGRLVFNYSYMDVGDNIELSISNSIIHFSGLSRTFEEARNSQNDEIHKFVIYEEYMTIELVEPIDGKIFTNFAYPGDFEHLMENRYQKKFGRQHYIPRQ
jgi:hypothetical protein